MRIREFIVDDNHVTREGLRSAIEARSSDIQVVGEASNGLAALETVGKIGVDVYIMDVSMPVLNGIETTQRLIDCISCALDLTTRAAVPAPS